MSDPGFFKSKGFKEGSSMAMPGNGYRSVVRSNCGKDRSIKNPSHCKNFVKNQKVVKVFGDMMESPPSIFLDKKPKEVWISTKEHEINVVLKDRSSAETTLTPPFFLLQCGYHVKISTNEDGAINLHIREPF